MGYEAIHDLIARHLGCTPASIGDRSAEAIRKLIFRIEDPATFCSAVAAESDVSVLRRGNGGGSFLEPGNGVIVVYDVVEALNAQLQCSATLMIMTGNPPPVILNCPGRHAVCGTSIEYISSCPLCMVAFPSFSYDEGLRSLAFRYNMKENPFLATIRKRRAFKAMMITGSDGVSEDYESENVSPNISPFPRSPIRSEEKTSPDR